MELVANMPSQIKSRMAARAGSKADEEEREMRLVLALSKRCLALAIWFSMASLAAPFLAALGGGRRGSLTLRLAEDALTRWLSSGGKEKLLDLS
jgi:hypothetical protein